MEVHDDRPEWMIEASYIFAQCKNLLCLVAHSFEQNVIKLYSNVI